MEECSTVALTSSADSNGTEAEDDFHWMAGINYEDLPCLQVISELNDIPQLTASDPDTNMPSKVNFD